MSLQALEFRKMGASYSAICAQLMDPDTDPQVPYYKSRQAVQMAVKSILKRTAAEPAAEVRGLALERLDAMLSGVWARASAGDAWAIDRALAIEARRASLLGLNAPTKIESDNKHEVAPGGVMIVPGMATDPAAWAALVAKQQADLMAKTAAAQDEPPAP